MAKPPGNKREADNINNNVRLIKFEELSGLLDLYKYLNPDDPDMKETEYIKELWKEVFNEPGRYYFVVEEDGLIVSSCTLMVIKNLTRSGRPFGFIENVVTHPDYRKRGYGTAILHKAVETARQKNCYKVMLLTGKKEESVLRFYEQAGFEKGKKTGFIMRL
jgi:GNAT superfamily N-acetyltransferase